jgi:hypothetical protein
MRSIRSDQHDRDTPVEKRSPEDYEPPRIRVLGTLAEITRGTHPTTTDGFGPGSTL